MFIEIVQRLWMTTPRQIVGRSAGDVFQRGDFSCNKRNVMQRTAAHHTIHTFLNQVDRPVSTAEFELYSRTPAKKSGNCGITSRCAVTVGMSTRSLPLGDVTACRTAVSISPSSCSRRTARSC